MIIGIGTDLVRIDRLERAMSRFGERFAERVFTRRERQLCSQKKDRFSCFAKRFAAKEALVKAMGTGMRQGVWFRDVEVLNNPLGQPVITLQGQAGWRVGQLGPVKIHVSLSDEGGFALAFVMLERQGDHLK